VDPLAAVEPAPGPGVSRLWAIATIAGREVRGELVGFSGRIAVVAFDRAQPLAAGSALRLRLGADTGNVSEDAAVVARVLQVLLARDGRPAVAFTLPDDEAQSRREEVRAPFDVRIDLIVCDGRVGGDAHQRAQAIDLSATGISIHSERGLPPMTAVLLRMKLPRSNTPMQFRAQVRWCRPTGNQYLCGLLFTGLKGSQGRDIAAAVLELSNTQS
jgi:hypothetical protein